MVIFSPYILNKVLRLAHVKQILQCGTKNLNLLVVSEKTKKTICQNSRMKYIVVMFFMLSSCAVLAQMQFGMIQMLLMEERCKKCNMCSLSTKYCGICDANSGGICLFCKNNHHCNTTCVNMCGGFYNPV